MNVHRSRRFSDGAGSGAAASAKFLLVAALLMTGGCGVSKPATTVTEGSGGEASTGGSSGSGGEAATGGSSGSGGDAVDAPAGSGGASGSGGAGADGGGSCNAVAQQHADEHAAHTTNNCDPVTYMTNPPSSGTHFPNWADYKIYDKPVPWGFLVHDLEHGAVVISYRCPSSGCNVDLTAVRAFVSGLAPDNVCLSRKLITVVPDPDLDVAFAASAWTWTLRADCFDAAAFGDFVDQHYAHGLERVCGAGVDLSATGWCP